MKKLFLSILIIYLSFGAGISLSAQRIAIKNNVLYDLTLTPNLGIEIGLEKKSTLYLSGSYNPFTFSDHKKFKHWLVQPEYRYWLCEKFAGTFMGFHIHGGEFSVANLDLPFSFMSQLKDHRYEGYFYGGGISIGHQWILSKRWSLEAQLGIGYARIEYDKYECADCGPKLKDSHYNYFGPTKVGVSLIYFFY